MAGLVVIAGVLIRMVIIPLEEEHLSGTFGTQHQDYRLRTGALFPRIG